MKAFTRTKWEKRGRLAQEQTRVLSTVKKMGFAWLAHVFRDVTPLWSSGRCDQPKPMAGGYRPKNCTPQNCAPWMTGRDLWPPPDVAAGRSASRKRMPKGPDSRTPPIGDEGIGARSSRSEAEAHGPLKRPSPSLSAGLVPLSEQQACARSPSERRGRNRLQLPDRRSAGRGGSGSR